MFQEDTVIKRIQTFALLDPDKDSYVYIDENNGRLPLSRQQLWDLSGKFASKLKRFGVEKGDIVCNTLPNSRSRLVTDIGILMAGGITMNGMALLKSGQDIVRNLQITKCKIIIGLARSAVHDVFQPYFTSNASFFISGQEVVHCVSCPNCPHLEKFLALHISGHDDHTSFLDSLTQENVYVCPVSQDDEVYMFSTSGTSGITKLVPRNHRELIAIGASFNNHVYTTRDVIFNDSLMGWIGGHPHSYFYSGMTVYSQEIYPGFEKRPISKLWDFLLDNGVTICNSLPLDIVELNEDCKEIENLRRMKTFISGGQTIPKKVFETCGKLCDEIITLYGSTETGVAITGRVGNHNKNYVKTGYAGQEFATGMKMVLRDENTQDLITEINKYGKLYFKGGTVLRKYFNQDDNSVCALSKDGWYDTSDVG
ncbi:hypothetical protein Btru_027370 [Bulinus truncatus]|nr:hypothetical protein Btru_027370 [Bulinus truncatus]